MAWTDAQQNPHDYLAPGAGVGYSGGISGQYPIGIGGGYAGALRLGGAPSASSVPNPTARPTFPGSLIPLPSGRPGSGPGPFGAVGTAGPRGATNAAPVGISQALLGTVKPSGNVSGVNLVYANQGVRNMPLEPSLENIYKQAAAASGITGVRVISGGQPTAGPNRVGSHRHDLGGAGDIELMVGDRVLNMSNPSDQAIMANFISNAHSLGATGIGAGEGYMGANTIHVGYGTPAVWGAGGRSSNAPAWLTQAYNATGGKLVNAVMSGGPPGARRVPEPSGRPEYTQPGTASVMGTGPMMGSGSTETMIGSDVPTPHLRPDRAAPSLTNAVYTLPRANTPPPVSPAATPSIAGGAPYVVKPGDVLWDIAAQTLGDPTKWSLITNADGSRITNPRAIQPGQQLLIPGGAPAASPPMPNTTAQGLGPMPPVPTPQANPHQFGTPATGFDTPLSPEQEAQFQRWKAQYAPNDSGENYDLRGAFLAGFMPGPDGHWFDTFKKPSHPTFSNESIYAKYAPNSAGSWNGDRYMTAPGNMPNPRLRPGNQPGPFSPAVSRETASPSTAGTGPDQFRFANAGLGQQTTRMGLQPGVLPQLPEPVGGRQPSAEDQYWLATSGSGNQTTNMSMQPYTLPQLPFPNLPTDTPWGNVPTRQQASLPSPPAGPGQDLTGYIPPVNRMEQALGNVPMALPTQPGGTPLPPPMPGPILPGPTQALPITMDPNVAATIARTPAVISDQNASPADSRRNLATQPYQPPFKDRSGLGVYPGIPDIPSSDQLNRLPDQFYNPGTGNRAVADQGITNRDIRIITARTPPIYVAPDGSRIWDLGPIASNGQLARTPEDRGPTDAYLRQRGSISRRNMNMDLGIEATVNRLRRDYPERFLPGAPPLNDTIYDPGAPPRTYRAYGFPLDT